MSLLRAIATVGGYTMVSRITGFLRDVLIAATLGAGPVADAFFVAFKLPNFFRRLTGEGALTVAFVPIYAGLLEGEGKEVAQRFAREVASVLVAGLLAFLLAVELCMPWVMMGLAPGFIDTPERFDLAVELTRITFPYLPLISMVALMGAMLNSQGRFAAMASAPIWLNVILIAAMLGAANILDTPGHVLAWGVVAAGVVQFLWLVEACRRAGIVPWPWLPRLTPRVRELLRLMVPAIIGAGVVQINLLIDLVLASTLPTGSVSFLYYADRVNQLPLGVIGIAIGTALLPMLSRQFRAGAVDEANATQNQALEFGLLLTIPAAVGLVLVAEPIITVLFQRGAFDAVAADKSAWALMAYAAGLPAFVLVKIFQPGFFARKDTATPVRVAVVAVAVNLILNLILMQYLAHVGLALATSIASWVNATLLAGLLHRRGDFRLSRRTASRTVRILLAALAMAGVLYLVLERVQQIDALMLIVLVLGGIAFYGLAAVVLGAARPSEIRAALRRGGAANSDET